MLKRPGKAYYALKYFGALYRLGKAVTCEVEGGQGADGLWCVAAKGMRLSAASAPKTAPPDWAVSGSCAEFGGGV